MTLFPIFPFILSLLATIITISNTISNYLLSTQISVSVPLFFL